MKQTLVAALCLLMLLTGCSATRPEYFTSHRKTSFDHFATVCTVLVYDDFTSDRAIQRFEEAWREIDDMLTEVEQALSVNIPESDIAKFNRAGQGESVLVRPLTAHIVQMAMDAYNLTEGAYNPAVSHLVDLWGFSPRIHSGFGPAMPYDRPRNPGGGFPLPDPRYVEAFLTLADFSGVRLSGDETVGYTLTKLVPDIEVDGVTYSLKIDLGGIGKGYATDLAADILGKYGYKYGFVNLGMSSLRLLKRHISNQGAPGDNMWAINVVNPDEQALRYMTAFGKDVGLSTSGTYLDRYFVDGREYSHIIDPYTGQPTTSDVASVTLIGGTAGESDALSTALCVMGSEKAVAFAKTHLENWRYAILVRRAEGLELITNIPQEEYLLEG